MKTANEKNIDENKNREDSIAGIIEKLKQTQTADREELCLLLTEMNGTDRQKLYDMAQETSRQRFGNRIFVRGLIEFTNYCKNDCNYCGIRRSNQNVERYRLSREEILACCDMGYELGYRTFVLQGGEDGWYTDARLIPLIREIKKLHPDCALTLSLGERSRESYQALYDAGADRYLLREETATEEHYRKLHPAEMSLENRLACLDTLKEIGYQTGCGFMVGSPHQTIGNLADELLYIKRLQPEMIGIGPFLPHKDTIYADCAKGSLVQTLDLVAILRLMHPDALIPATTAVGTIDSRGREKAVLAGANVIMPNLSPTEVRDKYLLYDNKICTGDAAESCRGCLGRRMESIGYRIVTDRGDYKKRD